MPNTVSTLPQRFRSFSAKPAVRRTAISAGVLFLLYNLAGYVAAPALIKWQAEKQASEKLHRALAIGKVEVNPYALTLTIRDLKLQEPEGGAVFAAFDTLTVDLSSESLYRFTPVVQEVRLTRPYLHVERKDARHTNFDDIVALMANQPPSPEPPRFSVNNIQVEGGRIDFEDKAARTSHAVTDLALGVPFISSLPSGVNVFVEPLLSAKVDGTPMLVKGKLRPFAEPKDAVVELNLDGLDVTRYLTYLPLQSGVKVGGARLDARLVASFQQPKDNAPALALSGTAALKSLEVREQDGKPMLKLPELAVTLDNAKLFGGPLEIKKVLVNGLEAHLTRGRDNRLNLEHLLPVPAVKQTATAHSAPATESAGMRIALAELDIRGAALHYADEQPASPMPMRAGVEKFDLAVRRIALDTGKKTVRIGEIGSDSGSFLLRRDMPAAASGPGRQAPDAQAATRAAAAKSDPSYAVSVGRVDIRNWSARLEDKSRPETAATEIAPLSLSLRDLSTASAAPARMELKATVNKTGQMDVAGNLGLAPLSTDLALNIKGMDLLPLQPYVTDKINLQVTRASLSTKGRVRLDQTADGTLKGGFKGDMAVDNLTTTDKTGGNDFLRWKLLSFSGMDMRLAPFALTVDQAALNDFFARIIIDPSGRINLQRIASGTTPAQADAADTAKRPPAAAPVVQPSASATPKDKMPPISIRTLKLTGGRVRFTDNFIKPNYTATLTNFGGTVSGLSSDPSSSASVDLRGEVNRAPLSVAGRINPLKRDLSLDLKAQVRGMELAALSPYSDRYMGYGIEKGKLSFDVSYRVEDRKLSAANRLVLDQLTFGHKVDSPSAIKLPLQLAVSLLQDRDGVIDINVPIDGSLDDPQFSIGGVILKVVRNAIAKAVTKPFALIGSLFGGNTGEELSSLAFDPGRATIAQPQESKLKVLAKAMTERPALKLEITGWADPATDTDGLKRAAIDRKVRALKLKDLQARGESPEPGSVQVRADEYPALLTRVYKDEKFAKPRNLIGLQKNIPVADMERLMMENTEIDEDDLTSLGNRRAQAVKDWMLKFGQVPGERVFILASRTGTKGADNGAGGASAGRVEFSLR